MLSETFSRLGGAFEGTAAAALAASFAWGALSVILSPCHLAGIPLVIGYIEGQGKVAVPRAALLSTLFSFGILLTIAAIGVATSLAGRMAGDMGAWCNYAVALIFFAVGLHLLEIVRLPMPDPKAPGGRMKGLAGAFALGLVFGVALGPCTFAYMAPMLALSFKLAANNPAFSFALLAAYGIGHCGVIVAAGASAGLVQKYLDWGEESKVPLIAKKACGALVILGGLYLIYAAP